MGFLLRRASAVLFTALLALLCGFPAVLGQDLRERDVLCNADGCFVAYFQQKTFLDSWRACKEKGGDLATIKRSEDALSIATLFSTVDLRHSRTKVQVWIGLQRQPRQCAANHPLRGFSWTTGDQDTEHTNWGKEDSPSLCLMSRCVVMGYSTLEETDNFKWLDGSCSVPVDGYLCHYAYKGMCPALWNEGAGNAMYTTPFDLLSTQLTHVPLGSVATVPCPTGVKEEQSALCMQREDGFVGWSREAPLCSAPSVSHRRCDQDNGGCEHFCRAAGGHFYCECGEGFQLGDDERSCVLSDVCENSHCEFECLRVSESYRCACPDGYMLAPDEQGCLDVDECLQSPCEHLCENSLGTYQCLCQEGYFTDDKGVCEDIDECNNDPCEHACENTLGSHICHCHLGYSPTPDNQSQCQDIDECQFHGTCEQMCVNYEGGFECYCEEGYELMSDLYSCRKRGKGDIESAVTPFPWVTHQSGPVWVPVDYDWSPEQSHTDWPIEEEQSLDWLTDPPKVLNSDVIWVTSGPKVELPFNSGLDPIPLFTEKYDDDQDRFDWEEMGQRSESVLEDFLTTPYTPPITTVSTPTLTPNPDWYDEEEETTTAASYISTSTISEGAWNWWVELSTTSQVPGNTEDSVTDHNMSTESSDPKKADEEQHLHKENSLFPEEESEVKDGDYGEVTHSPAPTLPTEPTASHQPPSEGGGNVDIVDSFQDGRGQKQSSTWLLVGLLVPISIFIVVMVALGIVYCTRCGVQPRNKNASDCYHWISGAHDKQGTPNPSAGVKTHV